MWAQDRKKIRGYEYPPGSEIYHIQYFDIAGKRCREKVVRRSDAITLLAERKTEKLQRKKLPENLRRSVVTFGDLSMMPWKSAGKTTTS